VPGLAAKPIIDLMPLVTSWVSLTESVAALKDSVTIGTAELGISEGAISTLSNEAGIRIVQLHFS